MLLGKERADGIEVGVRGDRRFLAGSDQRRLVLDVLERRVVDGAAREDEPHGDRQPDAEHDGQPDGLKEPCAEARHGEVSLYPAPRTVRIESGSPSLRRNCATCTSTVRVPPGYVIPQTMSRSFSRESTIPGCSRKQASRSNSLLVSSIAAPATVTSCESRRRTMSRPVSNASSPRCSKRRRIALIRAANSRGENGFGT